MKKATVLVSAIAVIVLAGFYQWPCEVNKSYAGVVVSGEKIKKEEIVIKGTVTKKILDENEYDLEVAIGLRHFAAKTLKSKGLSVRKLNDKIHNAPILLSVNELGKGRVKSTGMIYMTNDLKKLFGYSDMIRHDVKDQEAYFAAPATDMNSAEAIKNDSVFGGR